MAIFTVRTTRGREKTVVKTLRTKVSSGNYEGIQAVFYPSELSGYLFVEGEAEKHVVNLIKGVRHVRGTISQPVGIEQITSLLSTEEKEIELEVGDTVEVIGGPFQGERAKIDRVDKANREVTVELLEAAVPIPVTISADMVRKRSE